MDAHDLDPHFLLPVWQALVRYFRAYPPVIQAPQQLDLPLPKEQRKSHAQPVKQRSYLPKDIERRLPPQPSP